MVINVTVPYTMEQEIMNDVQPLLDSYNYESIGSEMSAKFFKAYGAEHNKWQSETINLLMLLVASNEEWLNGFDNSNIVLFGPCSRESKATKRIVYSPDMVETNEISLEEHFNFKKLFYTTKEADIICDTKKELIIELEKLLSKSKTLS